jgi:DHA1 family multidrug resistance protein-like MFS transporter
VVESYLGWRWVFWIMMIFAGVCTVIMLFTLPETYAPVILQKKVHQYLYVDL